MKVKRWCWGLKLESMSRGCEICSPARSLTLKVKVLPSLGKIHQRQQRKHCAMSNFVKAELGTAELEMWRETKNHTVARGPLTVSQTIGVKATEEMEANGPSIGLTRASNSIFTKCKLPSFDGQYPWRPYRKN